MARAMSELPPVCEHLHLPLQSGSDRILGLMRRGYTADEYRRAVARIRDACPGLAVTTDLIVGFPSETAEDFEATARFCDEIGFDNAFIFKYSPRPDTAAAALQDDVPFDEKLRRNKVLLSQQDERGLRINGGLVGTVAEVLAEGVSLRNTARWSGRTRTNKIVVFEPAAATALGALTRVRIAKAGAQTLYGEIEENAA
jgi:tRNA-2-methylthio-N6-dimethylallyladenosine synthase